MLILEFRRLPLLPEMIYVCPARESVQNRYLEYSLHSSLRSLFAAPMQPLAYDRSWPRLDRHLSSTGIRFRRKAVVRDGMGKVCFGPKADSGERRSAPIADIAQVRQQGPP
jgi:hypothetical protein